MSHHPCSNYIFFELASGVRIHFQPGLFMIYLCTTLLPFLFNTTYNIINAMRNEIITIFNKVVNFPTQNFEDLDNCIRNNDKYSFEFIFEPSNG